MKNRFSVILKNLRKEYGLSQIHIAQECNVTKGAVSGWESGRQEPSYDTLIKIAKFFSVSSDYLLGLSDEFSFYSDSDKKLLKENIKLKTEQKKIKSDLLEIIKKMDKET